MDFRERRQFVIFTLAVVILASAGFWAVRAVLPEPTCTDNRKNQGEEDADCGGPCLHCAFRHQRELEVFWVRPVKVRENTYDVAARIANPNIKLGASRLEYEFKLVDAFGVVVASRQGAAFIYPGETMHLAEVGLISSRAVHRATITFRDVEWVLAETPAPDIIAGSKEYRLEEDGGEPRSVVRAIISNRTLRDIPEIVVSVLALDEQGNVNGMHRTVMGELPAGAARPVVFVWPIVIKGAVSSLVIEARSPAALAER